MKQPTIQDRARRLLEILPSRGSNAFALFVESLREDYDWLADCLEEEDHEIHEHVESKMRISTEKNAFEGRFNALNEESHQVRHLLDSKYLNA